MRGYFLSRHGYTTVAGMVVAALVSLAVHDTSVRLYFDPQSTGVRLVLLTPVLSVLAVHLSLGTPLGEAEAVFARQVRWLRVLHVSAVGVLIALASLAYAVLHGAEEPLAQFVRNTALLVGLLLVAAAMLGSEAAWIVPVGLVLATYGFGLDPDLGEPRDWAVLLRDAGQPDVPLAVGLLVASGLAFVVLGARGAHQEESGE